MRKWMMAGMAGIAMSQTGAQAQEWAGNGAIIAMFYNEEMSVPKGWELTYTGLQNGVEVYTFVVRPETTDVDTSWIDEHSQLQRLLCGEETLASWVRAGMKARADKVVVRGGKQTKTTGSANVTCPN